MRQSDEDEYVQYVVTPPGGKVMPRYPISSSSSPEPTNPVKPSAPPEGRTPTTR